MPGALRDRRPVALPGVICVCLSRPAAVFAMKRAFPSHSYVWTGTPSSPQPSLKIRNPPSLCRLVFVQLKGGVSTGKTPASFHSHNNELSLPIVAPTKIIDTVLRSGESTAVSENIWSSSSWLGSQIEWPSLSSSLWVQLCRPSSQIFRLSKTIVRLFWNVISAFAGLLMNLLSQVKANERLLSWASSWNNAVFKSFIWVSC